uniref:Uncharacterized protein n=1 Tax=Megaselia scalaris TaxID=36166 RepID=T1GFN4_MEGSC
MGKNTHLPFVDFRQANDTPKRDELYLLAHQTMLNEATEYLELCISCKESQELSKLCDSVNVMYSHALLKG